MSSERRMSRLGAAEVKARAPPVPRAPSTRLPGDAKEGEIARDPG